MFSKSLVIGLLLGTVDAQGYNMPSFGMMNQMPGMGQMSQLFNQFPTFGGRQQPLQMEQLANKIEASIAPGAPGTLEALNHKAGEKK